MGSMSTLSLSSPMIYIVDDDASIRKSLSRLVKASGFNVRCFSSALEFLIDTPPAKGSCLVTDVCMPGMTGVELIEHLEDSGSELPVILITAYEEKLGGDFESPNTVGCLFKPLQEDALLELIEKGLAKYKG